MQRRNFFRSIAASGLTAVINPISAASLPFQAKGPEKPSTNINDALNIPRTNTSMPGRYPGKVVEVIDPKSIQDGKPSENVAYGMLSDGMKKLTGSSDLKDAWLQFVSSKDVIGLKVNPIGGKLLTTSHAVTKSIIRQLEEAGIPKENIIIWDRREVDLKEAGFTEENYPGIKIIGTEFQDENESYTDKDGKFYSDTRLDRGLPFYADIETEYDAETMPYMINGGKYSYFSKICTDMVTKIINVPVIKNAGSSITVCMKNLAFGSISNTGRLHSSLWHETSAYVCAFPPLRDKVVLNIADGLIGCFDGGPSANPQFICNYNALVIGSDAVAVDRICYDMILKKRIQEGVQKADKPSSRTFMDLAEKINLGVADKDKIELLQIDRKG